MKRRCSILLLLAGLMLMVACHSPRREARQMLRRAEQLAAILPDSTARLIDSVLRMPVYFNERQRMDMALLQAEALFGRSDTSSHALSPLMDDEFFDNHPFFSVSPDLERAAAYYARKGQYDKASQAALYSGFVQQHYNDKTAAMQAFKDAEHYGSIVGDNLMVAVAEYQIGRMLVGNGMEKEAINSLQNADIRFDNHYVNKALVQNVLATCYILLDDFETAEKYLQLGLEYADRGQSIAVKAKTLNNFAVLYKQKGEYDKAFDCLTQTESIVDDIGKLIVFLNKATILMAQGKMDSASCCFKRVKEGLSFTKAKAETKASAYSALSQYAENQGDYEKAYHYRGLYDHVLFNLMVEREQKSVYRIQQQYDNNVLKETMTKKVIIRQRFIMILSILAAIILVAFSISQIHLARIRKQEADIKASLLNFMQLNKELEQKNAEQEKNSNALLAEYKTAFEDSTKKLYDAWIREQRTMQKLAVYLNNEKDAALLGSLRQSVLGNHDYWEAMTKAFDKQFPGMRKNLMQQHHFSDNELKILLLSYIDTSRDDTALLLNISIHMVDKYRNIVRKKMMD